MENNTTTKHMKAKLIFNLPEDKYEWENAVRADAMFAALWDLSQELRTMWKYEELNEDEWKMVERIRDQFYQILNEHSINLDK
jgi:hypothetical protein